MGTKKPKASQTDTSYESLIRLFPTTQLMSYLHGLLSSDIVESTHGMIYGQQIKYVSWNMDKFGWDEVEILQVTDVQFGHIMCNVRRMIEYRDWVLAKENRFMVWTGDMFDAWRVGSPGQPLENILDANSQVFKFAELWAPARHRIIGSVGGNHERRGLVGGGDLGTLLATLLQIPYSAGQQFIDVKFGKHNKFTIALWHGTGGARTIGAKANIVDRWSIDSNSQWALVGHLHTGLVVHGVRKIRVPGQNRITFQKRIGCMSSSFLEYFGSYGEVAGMSASDLMMAKATLYKDGKWGVTLR